MTDIDKIKIEHERQKTARRWEQVVDAVSFCVLALGAMALLAIWLWHSL